MNNKEITIETDAGTIILYANKKEQCAGIMLAPKGAKPDDENIDIAFVGCVDDNNRDQCNPRHEKLTNLRVWCYEDVYDTDRTHEFIIHAKEALESLSRSYQPDSLK